MTRCCSCGGGCCDEVLCLALCRGIDASLPFATAADRICSGLCRKAADDGSAETVGLLPKAQSCWLMSSKGIMLPCGGEIGDRSSDAATLVMLVMVSEREWPSRDELSCVELGLRDEKLGSEPTRVVV